MTKRKLRAWGIELTCVGLQFRWSKSGREVLARSCPFPVDLEREPDNKVDENAVKVVIAADYKLKKLRGKHLGYLRRQAAEHMAPRLDAGTLEVVKLWVTEINASMGEAIIDAKFRDLPAPLKKVSTKAKKKSLDKKRKTG